MLRLCWDSAETLLRLCWDSAETLLRLCWDYSETLLKLCWDLVKSQLRTNWDLTETHKRLNWGSTEIRDSTEAILRQYWDPVETAETVLSLYNQSRLGTAAGRGPGRPALRWQRRWPGTKIWFMKDQVAAFWSTWSLTILWHVSFF